MDEKKTQFTNSGLERFKKLVQEGLISVEATHEGAEQFNVNIIVDESIDVDKPEVTTGVEFNEQGLARFEKLVRDGLISVDATHEGAEQDNVNLKPNRVSIKSDNKVNVSIESKDIGLDRNK